MIDQTITCLAPNILLAAYSFMCPAWLLRAAEFLNPRSISLWKLKWKKINHGGREWMGAVYMYIL